MDPRVVAFFSAANYNPLPTSSPVTTDTGLRFDSTMQVLQAPNPGSAGGVWVPGTNAQVTGQGAGPKWSAAAAGGCAGLVFTAATKQTLKLNMANSVTITGRPVSGMFVSFTYTGLIAGPACPLAIGMQSGGAATQGSEILADVTWIGATGDNAGSGAFPSSTNTQVSIPMVMSLVVLSSTTIIRLNGTQIATDSTSIGTTTFNQVAIGIQTDAFQVAAAANYWAGTIHAAAVTNGLLSMADIAYFEELVGSGLGMTVAAPT